MKKLLATLLVLYSAIGAMGQVRGYEWANSAKPGKVISCEYRWLWHKDNPWFWHKDTIAVIQMGNIQYTVYAKGNQCRDVPLIPGKIVDGVQAPPLNGWCVLIPTKTPLNGFPWEEFEIEGWKYQWDVK